MKKGIALMMTLVLALALIVPSAALADENGSYAYNTGVHVFGSALQMELEVHWTAGVNSAQYARLVTMVNAANARIELLVKYCQLTPWNDVNWLMYRVNSIVSEVMQYAERIGATVECIYTEYYIDGEYVLIDPLRVVDVGAVGK